MSGKRSRQQPGAKAAPPASAPARAARSSGRQAAPSAAAVANLSAAFDEEAAPAPKKARKAPKQSGPTARSTYEQYHTDALFTWGRDFDEWTLPEGSDRDQILDALEGSVPPKDKQEMQEIWTKWHGKLGRKFPERGEREILPPYSDEDEEAEMDDEEPAEARRSLTTPSKSSQSPRAVGPERAPTSPASQAPKGGLEIRTCNTCGAVTDRPVRAVFFCSECGRQGNLDAEVAERIHLKAYGGDGAAEAAGPSTAAHLSGTADLADRTFERLAKKGEPYPLYQNTELVTPGQAARMLRKAYGGTRYAMPSAALVNYLRSGRMQKPQFFLPRKPDEEDQIVGVGSATAGITLKAAACTNMHELTSAVLAIVAALIDRPKAAIAWICLLQSASRLTQERGWATAALYVERVLNEKVPAREDFGAWDVTVGNQTLTDTAFPGGKRDTHTQGAANNAGRQPGGGGANGGGRGDRPCQQFNAPGGCNFGSNCRFPHSCSRYNCKNPSGHSRLDCPDRGPGGSGSSVMTRESRSSGARRGGGGRGKGPSSAKPKDAADKDGHKSD